MTSPTGLLQSGTKLTLLFIMGAFINNFILLLFHSILTPLIPRTPDSMLFVAKEGLEGLKYNIGFGGRGW